MHDDTPNEEFIDRWLEKMRDRYRYKKLKQMSKKRLDRMEFEVDSQFRIFEIGFPPDESRRQGGTRAYIDDYLTNTKETLTPAEQERLWQSKSDIKHEIYRARGYRKEKRREHRSGLVNSVVDLVNGSVRLALDMWAVIKRMLP